jgi:diacylglycerol kinase family enzyme
MTEAQRTIPAFVNPTAGTADAARAALRRHGSYDVRETTPETLADSIRAAVADGATRILVVGGDGTISVAASAILDSETELAIFPGGTLNHFARDHGISTNPDEALQLAANGTARQVDVGMVNGHLFLNTSSVGAYVRYVRFREYLERYVGYRIASFIAALRVLFQLHHLVVSVEVDGKRHTYRTPLVFIGEGERELKLPLLGNRVAHGRSCLHVFVVSGRSGARLLALALNAVARGVKTASRTPELDSEMVDRCTIQVRHQTEVAVDGELLTLAPPLEYQLRRGALRVVCP